MEVHHHPNTPKKWNHYLWEFLMLFLAVFCGFLAENFREHQVEKKRGKQYIRSYYEDLKVDTATFGRIIQADLAKREAFKNLFSCYDSIQKNWRSTSCLIPIVKNSRFNLSVSFSQGTLQQLKNAGGYRLLEIEDRDSIIAYDNAIGDYKNFEATIFQESQDVVRNTFSQLGDFKANKFLFKLVAGADSSSVETPLLVPDNPRLINEYFNELFRYKTATEGQIAQISRLKEKASRMLGLLKQKYRLE